MSSSDRWLLAIIVVVLDTVLLVVPITGLAVAYVIVARPSWFRRWVDELYASYRE